MHTNAPALLRTRFVLLAVLCLGLSACGEQRPWNVLLVTLDTTRADFLGPYGKQGARTPNLDRLAADGFVFEQAHASNPVTLPAHSTILTGLSPLAHGVRDNSMFRLPDEVDTLAEMLRGHGYATGAAIGGFPLTAEFGTAQGFDFYDDDIKGDKQDHRGRAAQQRQRQTWYDERPARHVNGAILDWLRARDDAPFFTWLHYWDPHEPHIPPPPYNQLFAHDLYQGEIAYADDALGAILAELKALGKLERTLVVVTADHGEGRREHGEMTHAFLAFETTLHVPLIVRVPDAPGGRRIGSHVGTVDIVPTVLDLLGLEIPDAVQGRSLAPLMLADAPPAQGAEPWRYYAESLSPRLSHGIGELRVLYEGPLKYIHGPRPELYDLVQDPVELRDLSAQSPDALAGMEAKLRDFLDAHATGTSAVHEFDERTMRRLAGLGYLNLTGESEVTVNEELRSDGIAPQDRVRDMNLSSQLRRAISAGAFALAARTARRLMRDAPDHPYYSSQLVIAYLGLGRVAEAAAVVAQAATVSAANVDAFLRVAMALFEADERARALALARRLVAAEETVGGLLALGRMQRDLGDEAEFKAALERAVELDPQHRGARLELATHLRDKGRFAPAEQHLGRLVEASPADFEAHLGLARVYWRSGRREQALDRVERSLLLAPGFCEAQLERLTWLVELRRPEQAGRAYAALGRSCPDRDTTKRAAALMERFS